MANCHDATALSFSEIKESRPNNHRIYYLRYAGIYPQVFTDNTLKTARKLMDGSYKAEDKYDLSTYGLGCLHGVPRAGETTELASREVGPRPLSGTWWEPRTRHSDALQYIYQLTTYQLAAYKFNIRFVRKPYW